MRKEVTLGMAIGGVLLVVAAVAVGFSHKNNGKKAGQVTLIAGETGGGGDVGGATADETNTPPKVEEKQPSKVVETKAAPIHKAVEVAAVTPKKDDPIAKLLFSGGKDEPPLISTNPQPASETPTVPEVKATDQTTTETPKSTEVAPTTAPSTQPSDKARTHTVQKGETFSTIAAAAYGSANYYPYIMRANPKVEANRLKPGMTIILPAMNEVIPPEKSADVKSDAVEAAHKTVPAVDAAKEYRVVAGDNLNKIALKLYGKIAMVDTLYEANKTTIGANPAALKIGMVLKLPQPPVTTAALVH